MAEVDNDIPRTVEDWVKSYHDENGVITRFVTQQKSPPGKPEISDADKRVLTALIENVLPHFDTWLVDAHEKEADAKVCAAAVTLLTAIMLTRAIRTTSKSPLVYARAAQAHLDGLAQSLGIMVAGAFRDDLEGANLSPSDGLKALLEGLQQ